MLKSTHSRSETKKKIHRNSINDHAIEKDDHKRKITRDLIPISTRTTDRSGAATLGMNPHEPIPKAGNPKRAKNQPTPGPPLGWVKRGDAKGRSCALRPFSLSIDNPLDLGRWSDPISGQTKSRRPSDNDPPHAGSSAMGEPPAGPNDCGGPADAGVP